MAELNLIFTVNEALLPIVDKILENEEGETRLEKVKNHTKKMWVQKINIQKKRDLLANHNDIVDGDFT